LFPFHPFTRSSLFFWETHVLSGLSGWELVPHTPKILLSAAAPKKDAPAVVLVTKKIVNPLPLFAQSEALRQGEITNKIVVTCLPHIKQRRTK
jgi:hypothetical protein